MNEQASLDDLTLPDQVDLNLFIAERKKNGRRFVQRGNF